jgi:RNA polymerase sigma factor (sigma-70 family)
VENEKKLDDLSLVRLAQADDTVALGQLLTGFRGAIVKAVRDVLAAFEQVLAARGMNVNDLTEDLSQDVYVTLIENLKSFDPDRANASFLAWASTLARNDARDAIKHLTAGRRDPLRVQSASVEADGQGDWLEQQAARLTSPSGVVSRAELVRWVRAKVESLREIDRAVLQLCDLEGKSVEEAAHILGISSPLVCMRRKRGRLNLEKILQSSLHKYFSSSRSPEGPS